MEIKVFNLDGTQAEQMQVSADVFGVDYSKYKALMHEVLVAELAAVRAGTASTKTRGEVRGGGSKPFRQKGTGRARQGSSRAPHMVGGGTVHGPKPRSYEKKVNKKARRLAIRAALSAKFAKGNILVLDQYNLEKPRTKDVIAFSKAVEIFGLKQLYVIDTIFNQEDYNLLLSARNIKDTEVITVEDVCIYWLLKQEKIVMTKEALKVLEEVLA